MNKIAQNAFQLKAHYFPITVIKLNESNLDSIQEQLTAIKVIAPKYFHHSPAVIDITQLKDKVSEIDYPSLIALLRQNDLMPIGVQGLSSEDESEALKNGLVVWQGNTPEKKPDSEKERDMVLLSSYTNYVVTKPVRSGMHIYAEGSNLILLAPAHPGSECIADGDIHCYAPVKGKLLAGAKNNSNAQIFCQSLEAELVSIAGYYLMYDEFSETKSGYFQISLNSNLSLEIKKFSGLQWKS